MEMSRDLDQKSEESPHMDMSRDNHQNSCVSK